MQGELDESEEMSDRNGGHEGASEEEALSETVESAGGFKLSYTNRDMLLEKEKKGLSSRKYSCEKCPYASALKNNFRRHTSLHGSKQG